MALLNRIRRLLGVPDVYGPVTGWERGGLVFLGIGILVICLGLYLRVNPKLHLSSARIKIETGSAQVADPYLIQTEFEVIRSQVILQKVIDSLDLKREWGKKHNKGASLSDLEAVERLRSRVELRPVGNASMIDIRVMDDEPEEAAAIANRIAETYCDYRLERTRDLAKNNLEAFEAQKAEHTRKVEAARNEVNRLWNALGMDLDPSGTNPLPVLSLDVVKELQSSLEYFRDSRVKLETQLAGLNKLSKPQRREAIQTVIEQPDDQLNSLFRELQLAEQKLSALALDVTTNNPDYLSAQVNVQELNEKIDMRVEGIRLGIENKLDATNARIAHLENRLAQAGNLHPDASIVYDNYIQARQKLTGLIMTGTALETNLYEKKMELQMPATSPVTIDEQAGPSFRPYFPYRPISMGLLGLGLLFNIGGILMLKVRPRTWDA